jgi:hypothetical protein
MPPNCLGIGHGAGAIEYIVDLGLRIDERRKVQGARHKEKSTALFITTPVEVSSACDKKGKVFTAHLTNGFPSQTTLLSVNTYSLNLTPSPCETEAASLYTRSYCQAVENCQ